ncbi:hypothetical protein OC835_006839 [Tilletia horrida]|nr:hypothetical protein OC835_006839 [Tilletia horrida]
MDDIDNSIGSSNTALDSEDEVDALDVLKPVVLPNRFLSDNGHAASDHFISTLYPERDFSKIHGPPDLIALIRDLAPLLPRHEAPWGDGVDLAERILTRCWRFKPIKQYCNTFTTIALKLWIDIKNDPAALKDVKTPGTPTHFFLSQASQLIRLFRRRVNAYVADSVPKRSRKRTELIVTLTTHVRDLREIARDARKKLGFNHKVLQHHPTTGTSTAAKYVAAVMRTARARYHADAEMIHHGYPDVLTIEPMFYFMRYINLEDVRSQAKPAPKRSLTDANGDGAIVEENASQEDIEEAAASRKTASAAATLYKYTNRIAVERRSSRLAFANPEQITSYKNSLSAIMHQWFQLVLARKDILEVTAHRPLLQLVLMLFVQAGFFAPATGIAELLVLAYRDESALNPKSRVKSLSLCTALGVFAICAIKSNRHLDAVLATENALNTLRPLYKKKMTGSSLVMGYLRTIYSQALLALSDSAANEAIGLFLRRKAYIVACWGVASLRKALELVPTRIDIKGTIAEALRTRAAAAKVICDRIAVLKLGHPTDVPLPIKPTNKPECCSNLTAEESQYLHTIIVDPAIQASSTYVHSSTEAIEIARAMAEQEPRRYTVMLAEYLRWKARLLRDSDVHGNGKYGSTRPEIVALREAEAIYRRLSETFPSHFDPHLAHTHAELGLRYHWEGRANDAAGAFSKATEFGTALPPPGASLPAHLDSQLSHWRGFPLLCSVTLAHAVVLAEREQPEAALKEAQMADNLVRHLCKGKKMYKYTLNHFLARVHATKAYAKWMLGEPKKAREWLLAALDTLRRQHKIQVAHEEKHGISPPLHPSLKHQHKDGTADITPLYVLVLAWLAGVNCALGDPTGALGEVQTALELARSLKVVKRESDDGDDSGIGIGIGMAFKPKSESGTGSAAPTLIAAWREYEPVFRLVPHLIAIHAGISFELGRHDEASARADECLALAREMKKREVGVVGAVGAAAALKGGEVGAASAPVPAPAPAADLSSESTSGAGGAWVDAPTYKTALLIKMRVLELAEQPLEAAKLGAEAEVLPAKGFWDQLQQCTLYDEVNISIPNPSK